MASNFNFKDPESSFKFKDPESSFKFKDPVKPFPGDNTGNSVQACVWSTRHVNDVIVIDDESDDDCLIVSGNISKDVTEIEGNPIINHPSVTSEKVDEDIEITFTKPAVTVTYPHARADCSVYPFEATTNSSLGPISKNLIHCDYCYCYICDIPAIRCTRWKVDIGAHCNAHRKAVEWQFSRNSSKNKLLMILTLEETTQEIRDAAGRAEETRQYIKGRYEEYKVRNEGRPHCSCICHSGYINESPDNCTVCIQETFRCNSRLIVDEFEFVKKALMKAVADASTAVGEGSAVTAFILLDMLLDVTLNVRQMVRDRNGSVVYINEGKEGLFQYIDLLLVDLFLQDSLPRYLRQKVLPRMKSTFQAARYLDWRCFTSLTMQHWDDSLLSTVLHGQNITGKKGSNILKETIPVAKKRIEILEKKKKWQQAIRYLKVTHFISSSLHNSSALVSEELELQSKLPMYFIQMGKFEEACKTLLQKVTVGRKTTSAKNSASILASISAVSLLPILQYMCGEAVLDGATATKDGQPIEEDKFFLLCLRAFLINPAICNSVDMVKWMKRRYVNETIPEPEPWVHSVCYLNHVSNVLIANAKAGVDQCDQVAVSTVGKAVTFVSVLAEALGKVNFPQIDKLVLSEYRSIFERNQWLIQLVPPGNGKNMISAYASDSEIYRCEGYRYRVCKVKDLV